MKIRDVWNRIAKRRYTRVLEAEVARLRAENRALLNSILGIAGVPPVFVNSAESSSGEPFESESVEQNMPTRSPGGPIRLGPLARGSQLQQRGLGVPAAVRHRSWQQVNRMLELAAMRTQEKSAGEVSRKGSERNGH